MPRAAVRGHSSPTRRVSLELKGEPIRTALDLLFRRVPAPGGYVMDGGAARDHAAVTLSIHNVPFDTAVRLVAGAAGLTVALRDGIYSIAGAARARAAARSAASGIGASPVPSIAAAAAFAPAASIPGTSGGTPLPGEGLPEGAASGEGQERAAVDVLPSPSFDGPFMVPGPVERIVPYGNVTFTSGNGPFGSGPINGGLVPFTGSPVMRAFVPYGSITLMGGFGWGY